MPDIRELVLADLYEGNNQYIVPPYQRTITWPENQWNALFQDVLSIIDPMTPPEDRHLFQIFQFKKTIHDDTVEVGDGQQRLVQTSLLLAALAYKIQEITRDLSLSQNFLDDLEKIRDEIMPFNSDLSANAYLSFVEKKKLRKPRVKVGNNNRRIYESIILWDESTYLFDFANLNNENIVVASFKFYLNAISDHLTEKSIETKIILIQDIVDAILNRFVFAVAYFEKTENMQASYEATNSRGFPLSASELIKNHIFQDFPLDIQESLVKDYWSKYDLDNYWIDKPIFKSGGTSKSKPIGSVDNLDILFRYDLSSRDTNKVTNLKKNSIFENFKIYHQDFFKEHLMEGKEKEETRRIYYEKYLKELSEYSNIYRKFLFKSEISTPNFSLDPKKNPSLKFKDSTEFTFSESHLRYWEFFHRISVGCVSRDSALVFLLSILRVYKNRTFSEICDVMDIIESYMIRKVLVTESIRNSYEIFLPLLNAGFSSSEISERLLLKTDAVNRWESDESVIEALKTKLYRDHNRLFTMLNIDYENSQISVNRKHVQKIEYKNQTLEHFMPQNPNIIDSGWPLDLPEGITREDLTYNFGNFLLLPSGVNSEVGNWSHERKVAHFKQDANELGIVGILSVDKVLSLPQWGYHEIMEENKKKSIVITQKYKGPEKTIKPSQVKTQMDKGYLKSGQKVYVDLINGLSKLVGTVRSSGTIELINGTFTESLNDIKKKTYPDIPDKQKNLRYEF